jgi:YggT family protein
MIGFLVTFINTFFFILDLAILARVLLSWVRVDPYHPLVQLLYQITEPILEPFRRFIPPIGMIDVSPIVAIVVLQIIQQVLISVILGL